MTRVLELQQRIRHDSGGEHRGGLHHGMCLVVHPPVLRPDDHELVVVERSVPDGPAHAEHRATCRRHPLLFDFALPRSETQHPAIQAAGATGDGACAVPGRAARSSSKTTGGMRAVGDLIAPLPDLDVPVPGLYFTVAVQSLFARCMAK
jgi:hypothetical protein